MLKILKYTLLPLSLLLSAETTVQAYCMYSKPEHILTREENLQRIAKGGIFQAVYPSLRIQTYVKGHFAVRGDHSLAGDNSACYSFKEIKNNFDKAVETTPMLAVVTLDGKSLSTTYGDGPQLTSTDGKIPFEASGYITFTVKNSSELVATVYSADSSFNKSYHLFFK